METIRTDLPFKVSDRTIVILRDLPVLQCGSCGEYLFEDRVFAEVEEILSRVDNSADLEVIRQEARRQSLLVSRRRSESETLDFIEQTADTRGWE
jgi:YgiT-type zinc finger domain-containing protein